ncbi:GumC family protein [Sphingomonas cavernae]|uniref:non-specific protein-tyrosine kinase n=1 Tax=Sphingomonas cavernae TaxID=2320861 RepID=A0A418W718_9SPHN|nr:AAA family ATPase [Sphingomonas cavernae]RJF85768.1 hypothetical protein D3876_17970 [Sphingomonas cavernae]
MNRLVPVPAETRSIVPRDDSGELLDLRAIGRTLRKRWIPIAIASLAAFLLTALLYVLSDPRYVATATMVVERQAEELIPQANASQPLATDSPSVDTAVHVLQSPAMAGRVVDALKLTQNVEFNPDQRPAQAAATRDRAIRILLSRLEVKREGVSYAIGVSYASADPQLAARVANGVIDEYIQANLDAESGASKRAAALLGTRLDQLRGQVLTAEAAVAQYRASHGLFAASDVSSVTQQELSTLNTQLAEARAQQAAAQARLNTAQGQIARGGGGDSLGEALNSQTVSALRSQRAQVSSEVANLSTRYGPKHPDLVKAQSQLKDIDGQIQAEVDRVVASLSAEARVASQRTASIAGSIGGVEGRLATDTTAAVRLSELERNAESARVLYRAFLDRYKEAVARQGTETSGAEQVSRAQAPVIPMSPNPLIFLGIALVGAVVASVAVVLIMQFRESGLQTADGIEKRLDVPALGSIPELSTLPEGRKLRGGAAWPPQFVIENPRSAFAEAFRALKTSLLFAPAAREVKVVAITSALPGEGKTNTAICLARTAAFSGSRTVLIDCDSRRRASSKLLSDAIPAGLADVVEGRANLDEALIRDEASGAWCIAQRPGSEVPFDMLGSEAMRRVLEELRHRFDFVVLDTAPVLPVAESRVLASLADTVLMLVQWQKTPAKAAEIALKHLDAVGAHVAGVALSRVDVREQARSGFGDAGLYFGRYKEYYS